MIQVIEKQIIKKITLDINGKEIELSLDEVRQLHKSLADLLNEPKITVTPYYPYIPWQPTTITWTRQGTAGKPVSVYATQTANSLMQ